MREEPARQEAGGPGGGRGHQRDQHQLSDAAPLLALAGIGKRYPNGRLALSGLDLALGDAEFLGLLGPSGCGKSTVLRLAAGLERPSTGRLQAPDASLSVGCVFQEPTLMPWASVFDNVYLPLRLAGQRRAEAAPRVDAVLERVGLAGFAGALPHELSGGMKMRAALARALVTRPRLLLLDEPFAALDEMTRERLGEDLLAIWQEQRFAALFVTHGVSEAVFLAQRVAVMAARPGRVVATVDTPAPLPRPAGWRRDAAHLAQCERVSAALRATLSAAGPDAGDGRG